MTAEDHAAFTGHRPRLNRQPPGLLGKLLAFVLSAALLVAGLMFSLVALAVVAVGGTCLAGWLWWKNRGLRRRIAQHVGRASAAGGGQVIDGEAVRAPDERPAGQRHLG